MSCFALCYDGLTSSGVSNPKTQALVCRSDLVSLDVFQHLGGSYDLNVRFRDMGYNHSIARTNTPGSGWGLVGQPGGGAGGKGLMGSYQSPLSL